MSTPISTNTPIHKSCETGTYVGIAEVYLNHPLWAIKTRMQCGYKFTLNPRILYRGAAAEAITMVPVDIMQMIVSNALNERVFNNKDNSSFSKRFTSGYLSGMLGGIFINGIESIMTLQQKYSTNFLETMTSLIKSKKTKQIFIGAKETSLRNGIYNSGFYALTPALDKTIHQYIKNEKLSIIVSGILAGTTVSIISHPLDMIKTKRQAEEGSCSFMKASTKIYQEKGLKGFYTGLIPRGARVISGIAAMGLVYQTVEKDTKK